MAARFPEKERALLLKQRGIAEGTLRRLEEAGYGSIEELRRDGVTAVIDRATAGLGHNAWANRGQTLQSALRALQNTTFGSASCSSSRPRSST